MARVGDAHTELSWREPPGFALFPIRFRLFSDGLYVTEVDERWGDALGARVLSIGSKPAQAALDAVATLFSSTESWRKAKGAELAAHREAVGGARHSERARRVSHRRRARAEETLELVLHAEGDGVGCACRIRPTKKCRAG